MGFIFGVSLKELYTRHVKYILLINTLFFLSSEISIETIPDELRTLFIFYTEDLFYEVKIIFVIFQEKKRRCWIPETVGRIEEKEERKRCSMSDFSHILSFLQV